MKNRLATRLINALRALRGVETRTTRGREIPPITDEEVAEAKLFFPMEKFFIYGHARSGTTMLTRLIRLHPEVCCNYQAHFFTRQPLLESLVKDPEVAEWLTRSSNRWNRGRDLSPVVLRAAGDFILERTARLEGKRIVGDKSPNSLMDGESVRLLHKVYPDARLIYIIRDGRDAVISHRFQTFIDKPQYLSKEDLRIRKDLIKFPDDFLHGRRSIFTQNGLRRSAQGWSRNVSETVDVAEKLFSERFYTLRYEDILDHPLEELKKLWNFLGAAPADTGLCGAVEAEMNLNPDADWQHQKAKEIAEPLQKGKCGGWRDILTVEDKRTFLAVAGKTLKEHGYPGENT